MKELTQERVDEISAQAESLAQLPFPFDVRQGIDDLPLEERTFFWSFYITCVAAMALASTQSTALVSMLVERVGEEIAKYGTKRRI